MIGILEFREMFDLAADAMFILDQDRLILEINQIAYQQLGYTKAEMMERHIDDFVLPDFSAMMISRFSQVRTQGYLIYESAMVRKDGSVLPVEIGNRLIEHAGGNAFYAVARDISERKRLDQALRESEARFRTLTEDAPEAIVIHDLDAGRFVDATTSAERLFACSLDEILRHGPEHFYSPDQPEGTPSLESIHERGQRILAGEQMKFERLIRNRKGQDILCEVRLVRLPSLSRRLIRASYIDITERKKSEAALQESEKRFRTLFEGAPDAIFLADPVTGKILDANKAACRLLAREREEIMGMYQHELHPPQPRDYSKDLFERHINEAQVSGFTRPIENFVVRSDGIEVPVEILAQMIQVHDQAVLMGTFRDITERKLAAGKIEHLAFYDPLTGLPNRRLLHDRLKQAMASSSRSERCGALLFIDLDNFKTLNDTLGHDIGDLLLQQVAQRLITCVREGDTVARLGGDEFVVLLEDLSENMQEAATQTEAVGEKILVTLNQIYEFARIKHHSTPSIGVTLFANHQETIDELLKRADLAMYQAKAAGRNTLRFYDPEMQAAVTARAVMEDDLHKAITERQFLLYYQAQVDSSGRLIGAEVLLRWQHPERGLVSPMEFIPLAEESGLILPLGHWVLETACRQLVAWAAKPETAHLTLAVNVSARQFNLPSFVENVLALIDDIGILPDRLKLELTESLLLENTEDIIAKMIALKARGLGFSLDDFGTGYSSLAYLKRLPIDQLKIDQSFVRDVLTDPNDAAIARTIVALGQSLGLTVIAEGVETEAQRDFLTSIGCLTYQGYYFNRPMPLEEFMKFMRGFDSYSLIA